MKSTRKKIPGGRAARSVRAILAVTFMALLLMWNFPVSASSSAGDLDPSFGGDGKVTTDLSPSYGQANSIAVQPDGKVVAAGFVAHSRWEEEDFAVARYNSDGTPDTTFGTAVPRPTQGWVSTDFFGGSDRINGMSLLSDGKIVVAGHAFRDRSVYGDQGGYRLAVARYNSNGTLDTTFGLGGKVVPDFIGDNWANTLAVLDDGKILVAGLALNLASHKYDFSLVRFNSDGSLDESFGDNGRVVTEMESNAYAYCMGVQSSGKIVVGGGTSPDYALTDFALVRYKPNGNLDKSFGTDGKVITDISGFWDRGYSLKIQPDDKILFAGSAPLSNGRRTFALARYEANGALDQMFGAGGKAQTDFGYDSEAYAVTIQTDGKIIAVGEAYSERGDLNFAVARYNTNGSLDTTFGSGGLVTTDISGHDVAKAVTLAPNGRIIAGGGAYNGFAVACYFAKGSPNITGASVSGKKLYVYGANFDADADIYLNGQKQKTKNDSDNPDTMLIGKKAGKKIEPGQTVMLQVRCPDGRMSDEFSFTRPVE